MENIKLFFIDEELHYQGDCIGYNDDFPYGFYGDGYGYGNTHGNGWGDGDDFIGAGLDR